MTSELLSASEETVTPGDNVCRQRTKQSLEGMHSLVGVGLVGIQFSSRNNGNHVRKIILSLIMKRTHVRVS